MLTPEMAQKLNEEDHTQVLTYEYDTPEKLLSMREVERALHQTQQAYAEQRADHPMINDEQLRTKIIDAHPDVAVFSRTHPTIFIKVTDRNTPAVMLERLRQMMHIRAQQERGQLNEYDTARAVETVLQERLK